MASILTNTSAITALSILRSTNDALEASSERSSSGLRVNGARDNASSFSIAQGLRSDINQFGAIQDSIGFGQSSLGVAVSAAENIDGLLSDVRERVVASNAEGADRTAIQAEIDQLVGQVRTTVESANFNGTNLLDGSLSGGLDVLTGVGASGGNFLNIAAQNLSVGTSAFDNSLVGGVTGFNTSATANAIDVAPVNFTLGSAFTAGDIDEFRITLQDTAAGNNPAQVITISAAELSAGSAAANGATAPATDNTTLAGRLQGLIRTISGDADFAVTESGGTFSFGDASGGTLSINALEVDFSGGTGLLSDLNAIDVTTAAGATTALNTTLSPLEDTVRSFNASLGSAQSRLDLQSNFIDDLVANFTTGLGSLVDADLAEESVLQRNLQTQQQLGIQSLTTAAASSQSILSLFR